MSSSRAEAIARELATLRPAVIASIVSGLRSGQVTCRSSPVGFAALRGVDARSAAVVTRLVRAASLRSAETVALLLETADLVRQHEQDAGPRLEVVWTEPSPAGPLVRPTFDVVREMVGQARAGGEVLVLGYSLTAGDDSPMRDVIDLLVAASARDVQITFALHRDSEEGNIRELDAAWDEFAVKPRVYRWAHPNDAPYAKLHAKALVVDREQMLVTSANLTYHGLRGNIELGVRVHGLQANDVALKVDHMIAEGVLVVWERR